MLRQRDSVAFAVDAQTVDFTPGDRLLADSLRRRGVEVRPLVWGAAGSAPAPCEVVVIRSTWDYVERPGAFRSWLDDLDATGAIVVNRTALLRWNMHKGYLRELADRGVAVVPTALLLAGDDVILPELMAVRGWERAVVKPAIGASARQTIRVDRDARAERSEAEASFRRLVAVEDVLVQPFLPSIESDGELSVVAIGGDLTHVVLKRATAGEWRVQSEYGGSATQVSVTPAIEAAAGAVLQALDEVPTYARIDLVTVDGEFHLMELELIEPELFFELAPDAADRLATLLAAQLISG